MRNSDKTTEMLKEVCFSIKPDADKPILLCIFCRQHSKKGLKHMLLSLLRKRGEKVTRITCDGLWCGSTRIKFITTLEELNDSTKS